MLFVYVVQTIDKVNINAQSFTNIVFLDRVSANNDTCRRVHNLLPCDACSRIASGRALPEKTMLVNVHVQFSNPI